MMHPSESELSLFAGGDLGLLERWKVSLHVRRCNSCQSSIRGFQDAAEALNESLGDLPPGLNWESLATEMTGNIHVGLAAGECVDERKIRHDHHAWRPIAVLCSAAMLLIVAWFLNIPPSPRHAQGIALASTESGIEMKQGAASLTILHTQASSPVISSSSPGQLRARYVDADTNQVTINNVYVQ